MSFLLIAGREAAEEPLTMRLVRRLTASEILPKGWKGKLSISTP